MEKLERAYEQASLYPSNLIHSEVSALYRQNASQELQSQAERLFCREESDADVDLFQSPAVGKSGSAILRSSPLEANTSTDLELKKARNADDLHKALWSQMYKSSSNGSFTMM
jgi:hypothetical protein